MSAIFYVENSNPEELRENFQKLLRLIEEEQPEIITLFRNWLNNLLGNKNNELNEEIEDLLEVKEMFEMTLKKQQKEWLKQGIEKGSFLSTLSLFIDSTLIKTFINNILSIQKGQDVIH